MDDVRPGYYAIIPADVRYDDGIPPNAKLLYGEISALIGDDDELAKYFDAWCLGSGVAYAQHLSYDSAAEKSGHDYEFLQKISPVRNLFTCESHNFLLTNLLRMEHENRFDEAKAYQEKLAALQKMPIFKSEDNEVFQQVL